MSGFNALRNLLITSIKFVGTTSVRALRCKALPQQRVGNIRLYDELVKSYVDQICGFIKPERKYDMDHLRLIGIHVGADSCAAWAQETEFFVRNAEDGSITKMTERKVADLEGLFSFDEGANSNIEGGLCRHGGRLW